MSRLSDLGHRLYSGEVSYNIVGRRKRWYIISAVLVGVSILSLAVRGLNLGIEFNGGAQFQVPSTTCTIEQARGAVESTGVEPVSVTQLGTQSIRITTEALDQGKSVEVRGALAEECQVTVDEVSAQVVGPTWGGEITKKALTALAVFLALLTIFLIAYFDWRMAIGAIVALLHDIVITIGIYSLLHFEVTPSTVIGILTILGYSLYDTVVVFDKVKENTRDILGQSRRTYSQAANLAVNQTLVRSINTTIVALLPVGSILLVGAWILGAGTLKDLSLALFVGMAAGAYSSIFIATPVLCQLIERQPQMQALARRVEARSAGIAAKTSGGAAAASAARGKGAGKRGSGKGPAKAPPGEPASGGKKPAKAAGKRPPASSGTDTLESPELADEETLDPVAFDPVDEGSAANAEGEAEQGDANAEALARARARRAANQQRNQPKRQSRSKR